MSNVNIVQPMYLVKTVLADDKSPDPGMRSTAGNLLDAVIDALHNDDDRPFPVGTTVTVERIS